MPSGNKPLLKPVLTHIYVTLYDITGTMLSYCNSFEDHKPADFIYRCLILKWAAVTNQNFKWQSQLCKLINRKALVSSVSINLILFRFWHIIACILGVDINGRHNTSLISPVGSETYHQRYIIIKISLQPVRYFSPETTGERMVSCPFSTYVSNKA